MPEGHIIHRLARHIRRSMGDEPVVVSSPQGRFAGSAALLNGQRVSRTAAWGKDLFVFWEAGEILHVHLGLIGKFRVARAPGPDPRDTIRLRLEGGGAEADVWDLTGPMRCELITPQEQRAITSALGADPLRPNADVAGARTRFLSTKRPVAAALLDQRIIAGIGNVYRAELLFRAGIHPEVPAAALSEADFDSLWNDTVRLMRIGARLGNIVTTEPDEIGRTPGRMKPDDRLYVYKQQRCRRCGTDIAIAEVAGRNCYFCPTCQTR
ncbi:MAG: DNA-formamidopyrimidine glycosylase family protein [Candidatus Microthrix parvicella]|jgi:endonuclease-8